MDLIYKMGKATARDVHEGISDAPSYSAVRALLSVLERKGHLRHIEDGPRYLFVPTVSRDRARNVALSQLVQTFFGGSTLQAVSALIDSNATPLSDAEFEELTAMIETARKEGR